MEENVELGFASLLREVLLVFQKLHKIYKDSDF